MKKDLLNEHLDYLRLEFIHKEHRCLAQQAAREQWSHGDYLSRLIEGEVGQRRQRALEQRLRRARFPFRKTLEQYQWNWPRKINQMAVRELFNLKFMETHTNVVFMGSVGLGKTHLAVALGLEACQAGRTVLTTNRAYKEWAQIFNNDATMTAALLDRLLHHVETILIEGRSYRSREHTETP